MALQSRQMLPDCAVPDSMAGIANSNSAGFQESMEPNRASATRSCKTQNPMPNSTGVFQ